MMYVETKRTKTAITSIFLGLRFFTRHKRKRDDEMANREEETLLYFYSYYSLYSL